MKTFRTALLAAAVTAGVPAMAFAQDAPQDRNERVHEHGGDRGERGARPDEGQRPDRGAAAQAVAPQAAPQPQAQPQVRNQDFQRQAAPQGAPDRGGAQARPYGRFAPGQQPGVNPDVRDRGNFQRPDARPDNDRRGFDDRRDRPAGFAPGYRPGNERPNGYDRPGGWNRPGGDGRGSEWRQDRRYDWRGYREQNRSLFRAPRYYAPRGWAYGYRRFDIGFRLPPFLFGSEYWIADPWAYRLPPVDGPYRWVRYYNDVLLIDLRSGAVVDEIPDFFW